MQAQEGQVCAGDHGTHVGALAAGYEFGAGKDATIVSGAQLTLFPLCFPPLSCPMRWCALAVQYATRELYASTNVGARAPEIFDFSTGMDATVVLGTRRKFKKKL